MGSSFAAAAPISNVFVYGSLLANDVVRVLLGRVPPSSPAVLPHYQRFSIKECVYPAIIPAQDKKVNGKVLFGITPPELYILDVFEDVEYERKTANVLLEEWKLLHIEDFMKMTKAFMEKWSYLIQRLDRLET
ncbi:AIG2-like protein D [Sesamum angolense]|uniref:Putative gamma-glutamylcyclotransferase n=1 Tax=Sesamum angolense TaxID=2727404 RepID=A0AAE1WWN1_9LAMI|nr:AIG2-like protein D [Sesamum angolense]